MAEALEQLQALKHGKSKRIRGLNVRRDGNDFVVDGETLSLDEAVQRLSQESNKSGLDYDRTAFLEKTPSGFFIKWYRCRGRADHQELLEQVKARKNYLWYGSVHRRDNGTYYVQEPHIVDWESVPEYPYDEKGKEQRPTPPPPDPKKWDGGLSCPFCAKSVSSTPGRTLHVKHEHPERLQEYLGLLQKTLTAPKLSDDDEDDIVNRVQESGESDELKCPFCGQKASSTPGRTLHVKAKHPERLDEYRQMFDL